MSNIQGVGEIYFPKIFASKIDSCINYLSSIEKVKNNPSSMSKLPAFRNLPWARQYVKTISAKWRCDREKTLTTFISACSLKDTDFTPEQRKRMGDYLDCFVDLSENYDK